MKHLCLILAAGFLPFLASAADPASPADLALTEYLRSETAKLSNSCLADVQSLSAWTSRRDEHRRQLQEMLGLWPMPARTDLKAVITGKVQRDGFSVEKLQFQASPGLYVTASLFVPRNLEKPVPAILYESGHWRFMTNGISYGNKAMYQANGAWYARNGYVCLVLDTVLAGEIQGIHTGTRDRGLWWWNSRGYTPAGVEAWFGIRALDYLSTRPEVDTNRFGITGHSGGGAYSWMVTALDDRIKAAAPLAGMADAHSHIVEGVIDSHCDCNFFVNYYRWDFPQVAALAAPRPLLIGGTDNDRLFNLPNTQRIHEKVQKIYQLHGAANKLGLIVAPGPHDEVPEFHLAVMRWFNRHLKGEELPVETVATKFFTPAELRVFQTLPTDAINTNIADTFVPAASPTNQTAEQLRAALKAKPFAGWPADGIPLESQRVFSAQREGLRLTAWNFSTQENVRLRLYLLEDANSTQAESVPLNVFDQAGWSNFLSGIAPLFPDELKQELNGRKPSATSDILDLVKPYMTQNALAFFAPRGIGLNAWSGDEKAQTKIRRRFMLLGQTVDSLRVWDIRRAIQALHYVRAEDSAKVTLCASGPMAANALYASLFEPNVRQVTLTGVPKSHMSGPDYLGVLQVCDVPQIVQAVKSQAEVRLLP